MSRIPLAREGYPLIGGALAVTLVFFILGWSLPAVDRPAAHGVHRQLLP